MDNASTILDFFELVWAESQSLDSRESKKDIIHACLAF